MTMVRLAPGRLCAALRVGVVAGVLLAGAPAAGHPGFTAWLEALRREAEQRGISAATLRAALDGLSPIPRVLELDRRQPEFTLTFADYLSRLVSTKRIEQGRERLAENRALLREVAGKYGVPPPVIVALWGLETDYGRTTGDFPVIGALATLAYNGRRSAFFREELLAALRILDRGYVSVPNLRGSWAGAMGQTQFLPSSFLRLAVDHDGDGRPDIWTSRPDIFASIANYLARAGWQPGETWGHPVRLPAGFDHSAHRATARPLAAWRALGVRQADGRELPGQEAPASLVLPAAAADPAFLMLDNHHVLLRWNRSVFFATAAGLLADALDAAGASPAR